RAQVLHGRPIRRWRSFALQSLQFDRLFGHVCGAGGLRVAPHGGFLQFDAPEECHVRSRLLERHFAAQPRYTLREGGGEFARQRRQFFIQGEKDRFHTWRSPRNGARGPAPYVGGRVAPCDVAVPVAPVDRRSSDSAVARRWAEPRHPPPRSPALLRPTPAPAVSASPRRRRPRSRSTSLSGGPAAILPVPAPPL